MSFISTYFVTIQGSSPSAASHTLEQPFSTDKIIPKYPLYSPARRGFEANSHFFRSWYPMIATITPSAATIIAPSKLIHVLNALTNNTPRGVKPAAIKVYRLITRPRNPVGALVCKSVLATVIVIVAPMPHNTRTGKAPRKECIRAKSTSAAPKPAPQSTSSCSNLLDDFSEASSTEPTSDPMPDDATIHPKPGGPTCCTLRAKAGINNRY